jgi:hypothetical protein
MIIEREVKMEISLGKRIFEASLNIDIEIGNIDLLLKEILDDDERIIWINRLGNVISCINDELISPMLRLHPSLDNHEN